MIRKIFTILMALAMILSPAGTAFAESEADPTVIDASQIGMVFEYPESYEKAAGYLNWSGGSYEEGLVNLSMIYYAVEQDRLSEYAEYLEAVVEALKNETEVPEAPDPAWYSGYECAYAFEVYGIDGTWNKEELAEYLEEYNSWRGGEPSVFEEIGRAGDTTFYLVQYENLEEESEKYKANMGDLYDEFCSLYSDRDAFVSHLTFSEPKDSIRIGDFVRFETTDLDGSAVTSEELFSTHKVTMINLWATWCGPCRNELPSLASLAKEFEAQDCRIIGICMDAGEGGMTEEALALLKAAGADYLNLVGTSEIATLFNIRSIPTSYFLDSDGRVIEEPVIGALVDRYPAILSKLLQETDGTS